eukprot:1159067-Pelagomonas_calceolata.AAC.9
MKVGPFAHRLQDLFINMRKAGHTQAVHARWALYAVAAAERVEWQGDRLPLPQGICVSSYRYHVGEIGISFSNCLTLGVDGYAVVLRNLGSAGVAIELLGPDDNELHGLERLGRVTYGIEPVYGCLGLDVSAGNLDNTYTRPGQ